MEKIRILHKKAMKLYIIPSKDEIEKKTSQQQGEGRARVRLEQLKNKFINLLMRSGEVYIFHSVLSILAAINQS